MKTKKNMKTTLGILTVAAAMLLISLAGCDHSRITIRGDRYDQPTRHDSYKTVPTRTVYTAPKVVVVNNNDRDRDSVRRDDRRDRNDRDVVRNTTSRDRIAIRTTDTKTKAASDKKRDDRGATRSDNNKPRVTDDRNKDKKRDSDRRR